MKGKYKLLSLLLSSKLLFGKCFFRKIHIFFLNTLKIDSDHSNKCELIEYFLEIPDEIKLPAVYIPIKDMLRHPAGFLAMANKYRDFPFDKTLTDIVIKASQ